MPHHPNNSCEKKAAFTSYVSPFLADASQEETVAGFDALSVA